MSNEKHTPEPYKYRSESPFFVLDHAGNIVADCYTGAIIGDEAKANAARIVACVNACAGIDNETLADMSQYFGKQGRTYYTLVADMREAQAERDNLKKEVQSLKRDKDQALTAYERIKKSMSTNQHDYHAEIMSKVRDLDRMYVALQQAAAERDELIAALYSITKMEPRTIEGHVRCFVLAKRKATQVLARVQKLARFKEVGGQNEG